MSLPDLVARLAKLEAARARLPASSHDDLDLLIAVTKEGARRNKLPSVMFSEMADLIDRTLAVEPADQVILLRVAGQAIRKAVGALTSDRVEGCPASMQCENIAALRFTWPGRAESFICSEHAPKLAAIAVAMGMALQVIPLDRSVARDRQRCRQRVSL